MTIPTSHTSCQQNQVKSRKQGKTEVSLQLLEQTEGENGISRLISKTA